MRKVNTNPKPTQSSYKVSQLSALVLIWKPDLAFRLILADPGTGTGKKVICDLCLRRGTWQFSTQWSRWNTVFSQKEQQNMSREGNKRNKTCTLTHTCWLTHLPGLAVFDSKHQCLRWWTIEQLLTGAHFYSSSQHYRNNHKTFIWDKNLILSYHKTATRLWGWGWTHDLFRTPQARHHIFHITGLMLGIGKCDSDRLWWSHGWPLTISPKPSNGLASDSGCNTYCSLDPRVLLDPSWLELR